MNIKHLTSFIAVAEQGSFSRAALALNVAQSALSRQVRALELELRQHLFARNGRGVELTEAGRRLLSRSREILQMLENVSVEFSANPQEAAGRVIVGLPPSLARSLTVPLAHYFQANMPQARLEIVEGYSSHMGEWLASGRLDLCLLYNPVQQPQLELEAISRERLHLVGLKNRLPARAVTFGELPQFPLIMPQRGQIFRSLMEAQALLQSIGLNVAWEVSSVPATLDLLFAGFGYAVLTERALLAALSNEAGTHQQALASVPIEQPQCWCNLYLAQRVNTRSSNLLKHTRAFFVQWLNNTGATSA